MFKGPDREQLAELYRRHAPSVHRRAVALLGVEAEAAEVMQDVFMSLLERPEQFRGHSSPLTFLYSATTHACLNRLRNQRTRLRLLTQNAQDRTSEPGEGPRAERLLQLRAVLAELPSELATVAVYYYLDEMTYDEVAEVMGCSRRHVANQLQRLSQHGKAHKEQAWELG